WETVTAAEAIRLGWTRERNMEHCRGDGSEGWVQCFGKFGEKGAFTDGFLYRRPITPSPDVGKRVEDVQTLVPMLNAKASAAYLQSLDQFRMSECLGWESKVKM